MPGFLTIVVAVAAIGYVLVSRTQGRPLVARRLLVLPVVLVAVGFSDLTSHLTATDIAFLAASIAVSVILGAARGATVVLYPNRGELWQRYSRSTVALWIALIAVKLALVGGAGAVGASAGGGSNSLLVSLGASLLAEAAIVAPRALSTGLPFAGSGGRPPAAAKWDNATTMTGQPWRSPGWRDGLEWVRRQIADRQRGTW